MAKTELKSAFGFFFGHCYYSYLLIILKNLYFRIYFEKQETKEQKPWLTLKEVEDQLSGEEVNFIGTIQKKSNIEKLTKSKEKDLQKMELRIFDKESTILVTCYNEHATTAEKFEIGDVIKFQRMRKTVTGVTSIKESKMTNENQ